MTSPSGKTEAPEIDQIITSMAGLGSRVKTDVFFFFKKSYWRFLFLRTSMGVLTGEEGRKYRKRGKKEGGISNTKDA